MRTSEERIEELHRRMKAMEEKKGRRIYVLKCTAAFAACFAVTVAVALMIANAPVIDPDIAPDTASASIFTEHSALGYVVVAAIAFILGAFVTIFCYRIRKHSEDKNDDRKH
jgi:glycerol uptake facilitator-like aquaporin